MRSQASTLLAISSVLLHLADASPISARDSPTPGLPYDSNTTEHCSWWTDLTTAIDCPALLDQNNIALEDFLRWNPSITSDCSNLNVGRSYCVEAVGEPAPAPGTTIPTSSTFTVATSIATISATNPIITSSTFSANSPTLSSTVGSTTTTSAGNGVTTPQPTQPGMVSNCNKFHWIAKGVVCSQVISYQKITLADFVKWNPTVGEDCTGMWAEVNVCVGVIGGTTSNPPSTTASAENGVQTPQPTQPGMVTNCAKFHWVAPGVVCSQITSYQKISLSDFVKWNPTVGSDCTALQANVNVCVGLIGGTTTTSNPTTTTSAGNGVQTPQPTQPGMVTNCAKFHWVAPGVVCSQITSYQKISLADFVKWNPTVGNDCTSLQANVNVCVGLIGGTPTTSNPTTTTSAGNGIQTPQPTQPGMVNNCKKFHWVAPGVVCSQIISYNKITLQDFVKWNAGVGSDCKSMWANTNVCVGV